MKELPKAYDLIGRTGLGDIHSVGYIVRHRSSGATLALVENDDDNKVFYIAFRTPPEDSTGVAHIIEHSVLCGSQKYPVKDPFVELVKGSLNTFLNAMTYPDKTVYPVASENDADFKNLMDVYMDAVLRPNIYARREIFQQEGWHYELESPEADLLINGVVYNEMKGAFSSPDDVLSREVLNSLFPDTAYSVESGGDPKDIPNLTYEQFLDFHGRYYHPCNSYIYLYGNMDFTERLEYLDREYLSKYDAIDLDSEIKKQEEFAQKRIVVKNYPIPEGEDSKNKTYLSESFVIDTSLNAELYQAFDILDYALLSAPGAPLKQALIDAGIVEDISGGFVASIYQPYFSIVAKGTNLERRDEFVSVIEKALRAQVEHGIDEKALLAAINSSEFRFREADFGAYPKGLMYGLSMLDSWLYDKKQPFLHLFALGVLSDLKKKVGTGYFEELIERYLLSNHHASIVCVCPKANLAAEEDHRLRSELARYKASLTPEEVAQLVESTHHLEEYQDEPSTPEELLSIPMLSRSDLRKEIRPIHYTELELDGISALHVDTETSGIQYIDVLFDVSDLAMEDVPLLAFALHSLTLVDTKDYSYKELSNEINLYTGGISVDLRVCEREDGSGATKLYIEAKAKFLYENMEKAFAILQSILLDSDFSDKKRLKELVNEEKSAMQRRIMTAGNAIAASRAGAAFRKIYAVLDAEGGADYFDFLFDAAEHFDDRVEGLQKRIRELFARVLVQQRLLVSTTGKNRAIENVRAYLPKLREAMPEGSPAEPEQPFVPTAKNTGYKTASTVNYVARAGSFAAGGHAFNGAMRILRVILSYDYLWLNIRMKGGAYGCMSNFTRSGCMALASYRDPNLRDTDAVFAHTPEYIEAFAADEREMTKYIIGAISSLDTPLTPYLDGQRSLAAYLTGITAMRLQQERDEVIGAQPGDIRALADAVREALSQNHRVVVGNEHAIEEAADLFEETRKIG